MNPTVAGLRDVANGAWFLMLATIALALVVLVADNVVRAVLRHWRDHWSTPKQFAACGILDYVGRPCLLPDEHAEREHATEWLESTDRHDIASRHRFDDTATEGRYERRYIAGRGGLPLVTRGGARVPEL